MIDFTKLEKALSQLKEATSKETLSDLERDGVIQRFEYTIEILWKVSKKVLQDNGITAVAPKEVIKELANIGWINNPKEFLEFIKMRNETSHSYEELTAQKVYEASKRFVPACEDLVKTLKEKAS
jgi:nucleotidyltransferase substrate binding protein (TIGR01987 family)